MGIGTLLGALAGGFVGFLIGGGVGAGVGMHFFSENTLLSILVAMVTGIPICFIFLILGALGGKKFDDIGA